MGSEIVMRATGAWDAQDAEIMALMQVPDVTMAIVVPDTQHPGRAGNDQGVTHKRLAEINEYGEPALNIPPRPIFGPSMERNEGKYLEMIQKALTDAVHGKPWDTSVKEVADEMVRDVLFEIDNYGHQPRLHPSTIERKGHDQPWIESGDLSANIDAFVSLAASSYSQEARRFRNSLGQFTKVRA